MHAWDFTRRPQTLSQRENLHGCGVLAPALQVQGLFWTAIFCVITYCQCLVPDLCRFPFTAICEFYSFHCKEFFVIAYLVFSWIFKSLLAFCQRIVGSGGGGGLWERMEPLSHSFSSPLISEEFFENNGKNNGTNRQLFLGQCPGAFHAKYFSSRRLWFQMFFAFSSQSELHYITFFNLLLIFIFHRVLCPHNGFYPSFKVFLKFNVVKLTCLRDWMILESQRMMMSRVVMKKMDLLWPNHSKLE